MLKTVWNRIGCVFMVLNNGKSEKFIKVDWKHEKQWERIAFCAAQKEIKNSTFFGFKRWFVNGINNLNGRILEKGFLNCFYLLIHHRIWIFLRNPTRNRQEMMVEINYFKVVLLLLPWVPTIVDSWQENIPAKLFIDMGKLKLFLWIQEKKNLR